jgi:hypothetical protein
VRGAIRRGVPKPPDEATWALGRRPDRTYINASFTLNLPASRDHGQPARWVVKVFDEPSGSPGTENTDSDWEDAVIQTTPGGRKQIKLQVARDAGNVREILLERVTVSGDSPEVETLLKLDREAARRLIDLVRAIEHFPIEDGEATEHIDDETLHEFLTNPHALERLYGSDPERFRELIRSDIDAPDLLAIAHRKEAVRRFRQLLADPQEFSAETSRCGGRPEAVWQKFLEDNPWILGVSLAGQLLTAWDERRLEQVVAGFSVAGPGKRADALLRTAGLVRSLAFAEIKHHETPLLGAEYRPGCWPPSTELSGGVTQAQQTVDLASEQIGRRLPDTDDAGSETGETTWLLRPRSFLVVGNLEQLRGATGVHEAKFRSFELYRRNLTEPDVITFDELLARAEWHVTLAESDV